jgi:hypothetical protein
VTVSMMAAPLMARRDCLAATGGGNRVTACPWDARSAYRESDFVQRFVFALVTEDISRCGDVP